MSEKSWHEFVIRVPVDDEWLARHDGAEKPPPNAVDDWDGRDIFWAEEMGAIDRDDVEIVTYTEVSGPLRDEG